jgi:glycosyltransferase involved in cell wall biosynthesis
VKIAVVAPDAMSAEISEDCDPGAQRAHLLSVAREFGQAHRVTIYTRHDSPERRPKVRLAPGVTLEHVPAGPATELSEDGLLPHLPDFGAELMRRWRRDPPDLVHAHSWTGGLAAIRGAEGLRVPLVQSLRLGRSAGGQEKDGRAAARERLQRAIGRRADAVIASCVEEQAELIRFGVPRRAIAVVPCGVDVDRFRRHGPAAARGKRARLLHVGPLTPEQGVHTVIRALEAIPDAELVVAGGPSADRLERDPHAHALRMLIKESGVEDRVTLLGQLPHASVPKVVRGADVVVSLPGETTTGVAALAAMACGVPVVASAVGAHLDCVVDGVTGRLVPPGRPAQTSRVVRELLSDATRRTALGFAGADRARSRYSFERIAQETLRVYEHACRLLAPVEEEQQQLVTV